jgi:hypothetical protein
VPDVRTADTEGDPVTHGEGAMLMAGFSAGVLVVCLLLLAVGGTP